MSILPNFRSRSRDAETDVARLVPVLDSVQTAARETERELAGLRARLHETGERAAFLFGNEIESEADADPKKKAMLEELEGVSARGGIRKHYLERQAATLAEIIAILEAVIRPTTPTMKRQ